MSKKIIQIKPNYIPLTQQKYCCFPCCIQWIMLRRGLKLISQEIIAKELGLVIPPEDQRLFNIKMKTMKKLPRNRTGWGIWSFNKVPKFLRKYKINLKVKQYYPSKIKNIKNFILENLKSINDIIVSFNVAAYADPKYKFNYVHSVVIDSIKINNNKIILKLGDPSYSHRKFFEVALETILNGMSKKYGKEKSFKVFSNK